MVETSIGQISNVKVQNLERDVARRAEISEALECEPGPEGAVQGEFFQKCKIYIYYHT